MVTDVTSLLASLDEKEGNDDSSWDGSNDDTADGDWEIPQNAGSVFYLTILSCFIPQCSCPIQKALSPGETLSLTTGPQLEFTTQYEVLDRYDVTFDVYATRNAQVVVSSAPGVLDAATFSSTSV